MKTVFVTGGCGFIGSHFIDLLLSAGYKVVNYDMMTYASNWNYCNLNNENYKFECKDISEINDIPYCDYIVHMAACSHVDRSINDSYPFIKNNVLGTYNLLEILRKKKIDHLMMGWEYKEPIFVYIGTDEIYGDIGEGFFKEEAKQKPSNPYSASKAAAEMLVMAWGRTYGMPYRITRTTNNYGPRQHPEKLIPMCITKCLENQKITIQGTGEYVRNWIHVKDNCCAILNVMEKGKNGEIYNISSDEEYSVIQIAKMVLDEFEKEWNGNVEFVQNRSGQDFRYGINCDKIKKELGWMQKRSLKSSLKEMIGYYEKFLQRK